MNPETKQAERSEGRSAKVYVIPAAIVAGWLMMFGGVFASVHGRPELHNSIETVLRGSSPAPSPTAVTFAQR